MKTLQLTLLSIIGSMILAGCSTIPDGIEPVNNLDIKKYSGTWYEIARFDSRFEKNLINVTATYGLKDDGMISVQNKGFDTLKNKWDEIEGKAKLASDTYNSMLKVSFFGPFYSGYNVIALDQENYQFAMVAGSNLDYLWILARKPTMNETKLQSYISQAKKLGFDTEKLVMVPQNPMNKKD